MSTVATLPVANKTDPVAKARALGPNLTAAADTIERTQEIFRQVLGKEPRLVRMPWLWRQPAILSMLARGGPPRRPQF